MRISHLKLKNWKNFKNANVDLQHRVFIVGPNASGKSNLLDVFRFLRDIARTGGGLQEAVRLRGGVSKIRCLAARKQPDVEIEAWFTENGNETPEWKYAIGFTQTGGGVVGLKAKLRYEKVWNKNNELIVNRPDPQKDKSDEKLMEYTWLEQPTSNAPFRNIASILEGIEYLHIIPQLLRDPQSFLRSGSQDDVYGRNFIDKINVFNKKTRGSFLKRIERVLKIAVPQFEKLELVKDAKGVPHFQAIYKHWRASGAKQWEDQFSDGTIRLLGFLWSLMEGNKPLLMEEPELSLHAGVIQHLAEAIAKLQKKKDGKRQVIVSTHSYDLLSNDGIGGEETVMLLTDTEGTCIKNASSDKEIKTLLTSGMSVADAVLPKTTPPEIYKFGVQLEIPLL